MLSIGWEGVVKHCTVQSVYRTYIVHCTRLHIPLVLLCVCLTRTVCLSVCLCVYRLSVAPWVSDKGVRIWRCAEMCHWTLSAFPRNTRSAKHRHRQDHSPAVHVSHLLSLPSFQRCMGVDHGGTRRTSPPKIWSKGTLVQIVPLRFLSCIYIQKGAFCGLQNTPKIRFRPALCPGPRWGSSWLMTLPQAP